MKRGKIFGILFTMGFAAFILANCDTAPVESCSQEEICTAKSVTACCTETSCVYKFDGKEYPADSVDQLADDLGCAGSGARVASDERIQLEEQLQNLLMKARAGLH